MQASSVLELVNAMSGLTCSSTTLYRVIYMGDREVLQPRLLTQLCHIEVRTLRRVLEDVHNEFDGVVICASNSKTLANEQIFPQHVTDIDSLLTVDS